MVTYKNLMTIGYIIGGLGLASAFFFDDRKPSIIVFAIGWAIAVLGMVTGQLSIKVPKQWKVVGIGWKVSVIGFAISCIGVLFGFLGGTEDVANIIFYIGVFILVIGIFISFLGILEKNTNNPD